MLCVHVLNYWLAAMQRLESINSAIVIFVILYTHHSRCKESIRIYIRIN